VRAIARRAVAALLLSLCWLASGAAQARPRLVVIGDVHGAYAPLVQLLHASGLTDEAGHWMGGDARLVQIGDLLDRGPDDRKVLDLWMRLEREAARQRGRVVVLLGNHEIMNLSGDWRYVSPESLASFGGAAARRAALAPKGVYGKWLRKHVAIAELDGVVFVHGGIAPEVAPFGVKGIERRVGQEIAWLDRARSQAVAAKLLPEDADLEPLLALKLPALESYPSWLSTNPRGPLWFRGYAEWSDEEMSAQIGGVLSALGAERIVVGHTPQLPARIRARANGRVLLVDTGMLDGEFFPGGTGIALELSGDRPVAIDATGKRTPVETGERAALD
jgi:hypothetical protein